MPDSPAPPEAPDSIQIKHPFYDKDDYTFYLPIEPGERKRDAAATTHYERTAVLSYNGQSATGRALVCRAFQGQFWSVTFRSTGKSPAGSANYDSTYLERPLEHSGYAASTKVLDTSLNTLDEITSLIFDQVFGPAAKYTPASGLLIVAGATSSAKSKISRGLLHKYLGLPSVRQGKGRRPHLVTFEDPIEEKFYDTIQHDRLVDYTPRERGKDAENLLEVTSNALRQTPAAMFIGETRDQQNWRTLLTFSATGHFTLTTAHAASLGDAMGEVLIALEAKTPVDRKSVADRLVAIVHLYPHFLDIPGKKIKMIVPSVWVATPSANQALMADGRASLVPFNPAAAKRDWEKDYCLGRTWFARQLIQKAKNREKDHTELNPNIEGDCLNAMLQFDLGTK